MKEMLDQEFIPFSQLETICRPAGWPGIDVMITIFGDFWQFLAKKLAFFHKNQWYDKIVAKISCSLSKERQYFCSIFRRKYLKIITSVPDWANFCQLCHCFLWADFYKLLKKPKYLICLFPRKKSYQLNLTKKRKRTSFWAIFSKTHLVTLSSSDLGSPLLIVFFGVTNSRFMSHILKTNDL
jgi:hypothetical protein